MRDAHAVAACEELSAVVRGSISTFAQLLVASAGKRAFGRIINCPTYPVPARTPDLLPTVERLRTAIQSPGVYYSHLLATLYAEARSVEYRKRRGQFFTPPRVAEWAMTLAPVSSCEVIYDAGCGTGVFAEAVMKSGFRSVTYVGIESDPMLALSTACVLEAMNAPATFKVWYANFMKIDRAEVASEGMLSPSLVISNPPFVRFHNLQGRARVLGSLRRSLGITLSSFSGSGGYFLCRGVDLLSDTPQSMNPRVVMFSPKEAVGAAHWRALREDLRRVNGWKWRDFQISSDRSSKDTPHSDALALVFIFDRGRMATGNQARLMSDGDGPVVGDLIHIKRGISTGSNGFFVMSDAEARERGIAARWLRAILPTRVPLRGKQFTPHDWEALRKAGHSCWLLSLPNVDSRRLDCEVQTYLKEGVRRGLHETPTARRLKTWYSLPIPDKPPDMFVTYLFREKPRIVMNSAGVLHLTNILGGRFRHPVMRPDLAEATIQSLNSIAKSWIDVQGAGREYRGGLRKIEPRELQMLPIDPSLLSNWGVVKRVYRSVEPTLFG